MKTFEQFNTENNFDITINYADIDDIITPTINIKYLTMGKGYKILDMSSGGVSHSIVDETYPSAFEIKDDLGYKGWYEKKWFRLKSLKKRKEIENKMNQVKHLDPHGEEEWEN